MIFVIKISQLALAHLTPPRCTALQLIIIVTLIQRQRRYPRWKCKMNAHFCYTRYLLCRLYTSVHVSNVDKLELAVHTRVVMSRHESRKSPKNENETRKDAFCVCVSWQHQTSNNQFQWFKVSRATRLIVVSFFPIKIIRLSARPFFVDDI